MKQTPLKRKKGLARARPVQLSAEERAAKDRWLQAMRPRCELCGRRSVHQHHVVKEQHVRRAGGDPWDVRNALSLCFLCHEAHHHSQSGRIAVSRLRREHVVFAIHLFGAATNDYFSRHYENDSESLVLALSNP